MTPDITSALRILYGQDVPHSPVFIKTLHPDQIKAVFRQRALELHPDRAVTLGKNPGEMNEAFKDVKLAYERILDLIEPTLGKAVDAPPRTSGKNEPPRSKTRADHYWEAGIPQITLLLGQYLYYSGHITFDDLISAVSWQRRQRPSFGRIARTWGYLTEKEIRFILKHRARGERIGEAALRTGFLSLFQITALIGSQTWIQKPFGEYFHAKGILEPERILSLVKSLKRHNLQVGRKWRAGTDADRR